MLGRGAASMAPRTPVNEWPSVGLVRARMPRCRIRCPAAVSRHAGRCRCNPASRRGSRRRRGCARRARTCRCCRRCPRSAGEELRISVLKVAGRGEAAVGARLEVVAERDDDGPRRLPPQFDGVPALGFETTLLATIEFCTVIVPEPTSRPPPFVLRPPPLLLTIVEFVIVSLFWPSGLAHELLLLPLHQLKMPAAEGGRVVGDRRVVDGQRSAACRNWVRPKFWIPPESRRRCWLRCSR